MRDRRGFLADAGRAASIGLLAGSGLIGTACVTRDPRAATMPGAAAGDVEAGTRKASATLDLRVHQHYYFAPVTLAGERAGLWLIDTGSSITIVESGVAGRLSLEASSERGRVRGIGGMQWVRWVESVALGIAGVRLPVDRVGQMNLYAINRTVDMPLSGIVGFDALRGTPFTLDPRGKRAKLVLHPQQGFTAESGMRSVGLRTRGGVAEVEADFAGGGVGPLVVDTGQDRALTLPAAWAVRWPGMFASPQTGPGRSVGVGGTARGREGWVKSLEALGWVWRDVPVKIEPGAKRGRIGMKLLQQLVLSFDAAGGKLWSKPAASEITGTIR
mgnify:CR=1 FL=1